MQGHMLIDGNSIGFAAQNAPRLTNEGKPVQAIFGFMNSMKRLRMQYPGVKMSVLWDGESWRKAISSEYKSSRDKSPKMVKMRDEYKAQRADIARGAKLLGITNISADNWEADDIAGLLAPALSRKGRHVILISGDQDWLQLVDSFVRWEDPIRERSVSFSTFHRETGYVTPVAFLQGKALMGDTSDDLKGVGGIGEKAAPLVLQHYGSVKNLFKEPPQSKDDIPDDLRRYTKKILDFVADGSSGREIFKRNLQLMALQKARIRPDPENFERSQTRFDREGFEEFCADFNFNSIIREMDIWENLFSNRQLAEAA